MGTTTALRREIKNRFIPHVAQQGFALDERDAPTFWIFRRPAGTSVHIFSIQWEKYGRPRFRFDFGTCPVNGLELASKHIDWQSMHPHWVPDVSSLQPNRRGWFRQDRTILRRLIGGATLRPASEVVDELLALYPEAMTYWESAVAESTYANGGEHEAQPITQADSPPARRLLSALAITGGVGHERKAI